jgi:hypothetical protein
MRKPGKLASLVTGILPMAASLMGCNVSNKNIDYRDANTQKIVNKSNPYKVVHRDIFKEIGKVIFAADFSQPTDSPLWKWQAVPSVVNEDGSNSFAFELDVGPEGAQDVYIKGLDFSWDGPFEWIPADLGDGKIKKSQMRNDGVAPDRIANDTIWTAGPFSYTDPMGLEIIIDNMDPRFTVSPGTMLTGTSLQQYGINYGVLNAGPGSQVAKWHIGSVKEGEYDFYAWWVAGAARPVDVKYTIEHAGTIDEVVVNQQNDGGQWNFLKRLPVTGTTYTSVSLSSSPNGEVSPDAIMARYVQNEWSKTIDNTDPEFTVDGQMLLANSTQQHGTNYGIINPTSKEGDIRARWRIDVEEAGNHEVYAWWTSSSTRAPDGPYKVISHRTRRSDTDVDTIETKINVDQRTGGGKWNKLGVFKFWNGFPGYVELASSPNGEVSPDAIMVKLTRDKFYHWDGNSPRGIWYEGIGRPVVIRPDGREETGLLEPQISVVNRDVPRVESVDLGNGIYATPHVINIVTSDGEMVQRSLRNRNGSDLSELTKRIYAVVNDDIDFFVMGSVKKVEILPKETINNVYLGAYQEVSQKHSGTGKLPFDNTAAFGSNGRLLAVIQMDNLPEYAWSSYILRHELDHYPGGNVMPGRLSDPETKHYFCWSSAASALGGFKWDWNGTSFTLNCAEGSMGLSEASPLDKYLWGFGPKELVNNNYTMDKAVMDIRTACNQPIAVTDTITINDIIAAHGERVPDVNNSQKAYNIGFVVESDRPLNADEMTLFENMATHATKPVRGKYRAEWKNWVPIGRYYGDNVSWRTLYSFKNPDAVPYTPPADLNGDDVVDRGDMEIFESCATGPGISYSINSECGVVDFDGDGDVDSGDFADMQRNLSYTGN